MRNDTKPGYESFAMRIKVFVVGFALLGLCLLILGRPLAEPIEPRKRIRAASQCDLLSILVFSLQERTNLQVVLQGGKTNGSLINHEVYRALVSARGTNMLGDAEWHKVERMIDPWGNDYIFLLESDPVDHSRAVLKVRSRGGNGIDEGGKGDDITSAPLVME